MHSWSNGRLMSLCSLKASCIHSVGTSLSDPLSRVLLRTTSQSHYPMNLTFPCSQCNAVLRAEIDAPSDSPVQEVTCPHCDRTVELATSAVNDGHLERCAVCPSREMFLRKDFPQQLGAAIVIVGLGLSCIPWYFQWWYVTYAILFGTATLDLVLYFTMGDMVECYRCHAQYRGVAEIEKHPKFELETFEKYRQEEARLKQHGTSATPK